VSRKSPESVRESSIRRKIGPPPSPASFGLTGAELEAIKNPPKSLAERIDSFPVSHGCLGVLLFPLWYPFAMTFGLVIAIFEDAFPKRHRKQKQFEAYQAALRTYESRRQDAASAYDRKRQDYWLRLGGREFEEEVASLLREHGHAVQTTSASGDEGVDLVVDRATVVQCKNHAKPVAPATVRDLAGAKQYFGARRAILISSRGFTSGAIEFARKVNIELWDVHTLVSLQDQLG
jgi:hypothetical protein